MNHNECVALAVPNSIWDDSVKGLHLRARSEHVKSWHLYYRTRSGRERRPKIGSFPEVSLSDARARAKVLLARVAVGEDPKGDWENLKAELTLDGLFEKAWKEHWNTPRFQLSRWAYEVQMNYKNHIAPAFGGSKLSEIRPLDIRRWHRLMESTPIGANRCLRVLSKLFTFAKEDGLFEAENPCSSVPSFVEKKRKRFATEEEIKKIALILEREKLEQPKGVAFLYVLMLSGARPRSIERALRNQITRFTYDGNLWGALTFKGKTSDDTGENEVVLLPPQLLDLVESIAPPSDGTLFGIRMPVSLWNKIRTEAGCPDLWARDLRRTFATVGLSNGVSLDVVGEVLNHKSVQTTKRYGKLTSSARIQAVATIARAITETAQCPAELQPQALPNALKASS